MQSLKGTVIANKMKNTVVVTVPYTRRHPKYGKILRRTTRLAAHNEIAGVSLGDVVKLIATKPYSKTVHFRVAEIVPKVKKAGAKPKRKV